MTSTTTVQRRTTLTRWTPISSLGRAGSFSILRSPPLPTRRRWSGARASWTSYQTSPSLLGKPNKKAMTSASGGWGLLAGSRQPSGSRRISSSGLTISRQGGRCRPSWALDRGGPGVRGRGEATSRPCLASSPRGSLLDGRGRGLGRVVVLGRPVVWIVASPRHHNIQPGPTDRTRTRTGLRVPGYHAAHLDQRPDVRELTGSPRGPVRRPGSRQSRPLRARERVSTTSRRVTAGRRPTTLGQPAGSAGPRRLALGRQRASRGRPLPHRARLGDPTGRRHRQSRARRRHRCKPRRNGVVHRGQGLPVGHTRDRSRGNDEPQVRHSKPATTSLTPYLPARCCDPNIPPRQS